MAVTASMVKELREMTGAGMMDCKKALSATDGDFDKAIEFLREKGLATAEKKAGRIAAEGGGLLPHRSAGGALPACGGRQRHALHLYSGQSGQP